MDRGADGYLTQPFGVAELLARVRATVRRPTQPAGSEKPVITFGDIDVDFVAPNLKRRGALVHLTPIEYRPLALLIANAGRVLTHRQILRDVWGPSHVESPHYVRVYMSHLREKLEEDPVHLITETAIGYRLVV